MYFPVSDNKKEEKISKTQFLSKDVFNATAVSVCHESHSESKSASNSAFISKSVKSQSAAKSESSNFF